VDRVHDQRRLHAHHRAVAGIDALHLACDQAVGDIVGTGAAIALDGAAQQAEFAHLAEDGRVGLLVPVRLQQAAHQLVLAIGAGAVAHHALILGQLRIQQQRVFPTEVSGLARRGPWFGIHDGVLLSKPAR
jgi:hypothetical protein